MHKRILSRWLNTREVIGHSARAAAVVRVVGALLTGGRLSLTHLGRNLSGNAREKHQIKMVDRLLEIAICMTSAMESIGRSPGLYCAELSTPSS